MSVNDPLEPYRLGPEETADGLQERLDEEDGEVVDVWDRRGTPIVLTERALLFVDDDIGYRLDRDEVRSFGMTRSSDISYMRWGLLLYLLALPMLFLLPLAGIGMALVGGGLVTKGFLSKAVLVQVEDERIPPFVLKTRRWKALSKALKSWK